MWKSYGRIVIGIVLSIGFLFAILLFLVDSDASYFVTTGALPTPSCSCALVPPLPQCQAVQNTSLAAHQTIADVLKKTSLTASGNTFYAAVYVAVIGSVSAAPAVVCH